MPAQQFTLGPLLQRRKAVTKKSPEYRSVEELTARNVRSVVELDEAARANRTFGQRAVHAIAQFCGSMPFVWINLVLFAGWIATNTVPGWKHFDPFPYTFLTLAVSLEAIFLSTFILISQNEEARLADRRNALDLQINLLAEQENTKMLKMLDQIAKKVGADVASDPSIKVLEQATRPEKLAEQIDRATGN
jgi:uncharacterized membrane protein